MTYKKIFIFIISLFVILNIYGCGQTVDEEYIKWESQQQVEYVYEDVDAIIRDINVEYLDIYDYYRWTISIYCPLYDMNYAEGNSGGNQFNPPSFVDKVKYDNLTVEVCSIYINGNLTQRYITWLK